MTAPMTAAPGPRHFLSLRDFGAEDLRAMLDLARRLKEGRRGLPKGTPDPEPRLAGRLLALVFDQVSTRTRVSFDVGMRQMGGQTVYLTGQELQIGRGESTADTARVLSAYVDAIMIRILSHDTLEELAAHSSVPVINGLTRADHPCQIMADLLTFEEMKGPMAQRTVAWVGDANNVLASWVHAAVRLGFTLKVASPEHHGLDHAAREWVRAQGGAVHLTEDPGEAVRDAECVVTDTWVSLGDEDAEGCFERLKPYQVTPALMGKAAPGAIFLHCLPAHRGEEVVAEVIDGPQSAVWQAAENRLHAQKGVLAWCLEASGGA